jgi:hypothetical protein
MSSSPFFFTIIASHHDGGQKDQDVDFDEFTGVDVYFNDAFDWSYYGSTPLDFESVVLHEMGLALGLAHFGKLHLTLSNVKWKVPFCAPSRHGCSLYRTVDRVERDR